MAILRLVWIDLRHLGARYEINTRRIEIVLGPRFSSKEVTE